MTYRIHGLPLAPFTTLFDLSDAELEAGARRMVADAPNMAPCRVTLADADPGDRLILLPHRHLDAPDSPYHSEGPIFVREKAVEAALEPDVIPAQISRRLLSVRVYDADWMMTDADVVEGAELDGRLQDWFSRDDTESVHIHTARRGCYLAVARRD